MKLPIFFRLIFFFIEFFLFLILAPFLTYINKYGLSNWATTLLAEIESIEEDVEKWGEDTLKENEDREDNT